MLMRHLMAGVVLLATAAARGNEPPAIVVEARRAPEWERPFAGSQGWLGADAVYSVPLDGERLLWLFGDTFVGRVEDGRRVDCTIVNNSLGLQATRSADAEIRFYFGSDEGDKPTAFFAPQDDRGWFWPLDAVDASGRLTNFLARMERAEQPGPFGFQFVDQWVAVTDNPQDEPSTWRTTLHRVPFAEFEGNDARTWGSALLVDGDQAYIYGIDERGTGLARKRLIVARAPAARIEDFGAWRFYSDEAWRDDAAAVTPLADGLANEFSVDRLPGGRGLVLVYTEIGIGGRIVARFAENPAGPWSRPLLLYTCPEDRDERLFTYAAKAHGWGATEDELLVSYCVNSFDFARLFEDAAQYRPRFVRVRLRFAEP